MRSQANQRGTAYVLVLGVTTLLVVMGLAGVMLARGNVARSTLEQEQAKARLLAISYLDIRHGQIDGLTIWRWSVTNGAWDAQYALGDGVVQSMYIDEIDGDLANDDTQSFRLYVKATVGNAVRVYSQDFIPGESNIISRDPKSLRQESAD